MSDEYAFASKSSLKLKGVEAPIKKKKKKKDKDREKHREKAELAALELEGGEGGSGGGKDDSEVYSGKTASEIAYLKRKRETELVKIRDKASMNHKEKVEKFNTLLNKQTEYYDI